MSKHLHADGWGERIMPARLAEQRCRQELRELRLRPDLREVGAHHELSMWSCHLRDADGHMPARARGCGKGSTETARTGAIFEALEHYLTGPERFDAAEVQLHPGAALAEGPLAADACAPLLAVTPEVACHMYTPLPGGPADTAPLPVPVILTTSWYLDAPDCRELAGDRTDYRQLVRYGCNSGSAIGLTASEALVHALNESIERDAISLLLARAFVSPHPFHLQVIDPATLPADLAAAHRTAQEVTGGHVHLLDATTDLGVPTFVAYRTNAGQGKQRLGAGTSLSAHHAAWRALAEVVQLTIGESIHVPAPADLTPLERYPQLHACARFDLIDHLAHAHSVAFSAGPEPPGHPDAQLRRLVSLLSAAGYHPYHRIAAVTPSGITAVHTFVPGLERFMLILSEVLTLPGPRARAAAARPVALRG
ncbi:YcaO-like family protein [Nonomuraea sp. NN258]|uniref:YcaO-like family protein n=1 Tax=Nonomuraea antri TaxID=2730852 RepID=UPI001568046F|nr:YcaO-like family protein [Nonomuraea antri]NRQ30910.1 YcaO-like family protein [Nonomuraea antri]